MRATRRDMMAMAGPTVLGVGGITSALVSRPTSAADADSVWPHNGREFWELKSDRKLVCMWHGSPISTDNRNPFPSMDGSTDWTKELYNRLMNPAEDVAYQAVGARLRQRPLPRAPRPDADWREDDMVDDVLAASAIGIDAFLFNMYEFAPDGPCARYRRSLLTAATRVGNGFKIALSLDPAVELPDVDDLADFIAGHAAEPAAMLRADGRVVVGVFWPELYSKNFWKHLRTRLTNRGVGLHLIFLFHNWEEGMATCASEGDVLGVVIGRLGELSHAVDRAADARALGKKFIGTVSPQDFRPKTTEYYEAANSYMLRAGWASAEEVGCDWLLMESWNDRTEAHEFAPSTGTQYGVYDMAAYFAAAYKLRTAPEIVRDVLFYCHRVQHTERTVLTRQARRFDSIFDRAPINNIELVAFLKAPGTLEIAVDGVTVKSVYVPAGIQVVTAPYAVGQARFRLKRQGELLMAFTSAFEMRAASDYQDLLYRYGSSHRAVVPMVANREFVDVIAAALG